MEAEIHLRDNGMMHIQQGDTKKSLRPWMVPVLEYLLEEGHDLAEFDFYLPGRTEKWVVKQLDQGAGLSWETVNE